MKYVKIGDIAELIRGVSYKKSDASNANCDKSTAILRANNIVNGSFELSELVYVPKELVKEEQYINKNDIMITMSSGSKAHVGKVAIAVSDMNYAFGAFCGKIVVKKDVVPKFLYYLLINGRFRSHIEKQCKGTNINNLKKDYILNYEFDLPSIHNQHRIVTRIEELFSQLDSGVETLKKTKEQLKVYRQAVLKEIFEKYNNFCKISEVCSNIVDCPHSTPKWTSSGKLCLRTTNFRRGYLDLSEPNYVSDETFEERIKRLRPCKGDVLYSREGAILGIACIIPDNTELCLGQRMMLLRANEEYSPFFIMHWLNSPYVTNYIRTITGGSASPHVNVGDIKSQRIPKINLEEQNNAVKEIESRLSVCDSIEKTIDTALQEAEALRQSILKQAFEGGL